MKTKIFADYHPEWNDDFTKIRQECEQRFAKEKQSTAANQLSSKINGAKNGAKKQKQNLKKLMEMMAHNHVKSKQKLVKQKVEGEVLADFVRQIHSYAKISETSLNTQIFKYECANCDFKTGKKSNYDDHVEQDCVKEPEKDMKCPICEKPGTYRDIRHHLNHFATGKHIPKKKHANYSPQQHQLLLDRLKRLNKMT